MVNLYDKVKVKLAAPKTWSKGAAQALDGLTGEVREKQLSGQVFVMFDNPPLPWWDWQSPPKGWHFSQEDLVKLLFPRAGRKAGLPPS